MSAMEIISCILKIIVMIVLALMTIRMHRINTIREWEIEKEREARKQPEFWDEYT